MSFLRRLQRAMEHHPVLTNSVICFGLWVAGDGLAQVSEIHYSSNRNNGSSRRYDNNDDDDNRESSVLSYYMSRYDWYRTAKCASYGALISGPVLAVWYPWLDRLLTGAKYKLNPKGWTQAVAKVAADEMIMEPPTLFVFYGYMNVFEGGTMSSFWQKLDQEFIRSWITSITYWPPVSLLSFRFLPVYWQAPVINFCCIIWDGYLSHRNTVAIQEHQHRHSG